VVTPRDMSDVVRGSTKLLSDKQCFSWLW